MKTVFLRLALFVLLVLGFVPVKGGRPAYSQSVKSVEQLKDTTPAVYIDLLFHKLTHQTPDFDAWAFESQEYKKASEHDKPLVFTAERNQLEDMFEDLDPNDMIIIRRRLDAIHKSYSQLQEAFFFDDFDETGFIEYESPIGNRKYALIIDGIGKYSKIDMPREKADELLRHLGQSGDALVELRIKPLKADAETPFEYHGEKFLLIVGQLAQFSIWSNRKVKRKVWEDTAEWYVKDNPLLDLYDSNSLK